MVAYTTHGAHISFLLVGWFVCTLPRRWRRRQWASRPCSGVLAPRRQRARHAEGGRGCPGEVAPRAAPEYSMPPEVLLPPQGAVFRARLLAHGENADGTVYMGGIEG